MPAAFFVYSGVAIPAYADHWNGRFSILTSLAPVCRLFIFNNKCLIFEYAVSATIPGTYFARFKTAFG